jgi:hypothetical protein
VLFYFYLHFGSFCNCLVWGINPISLPTGYLSLTSSMQLQSLEILCHNLVDLAPALVDEVALHFFFHSIIRFPCSAAASVRL